MAEIIMLGTGSAFPTRSYNTCFVVRDAGLLLLTDGGGGNGIIAALARAGMQPVDLRHIFLSHAHTDHILGLVWVLRGIVNKAIEGLYSGHINLYAGHQAAQALLGICRLTYLPAYYDCLLEVLRLHEVYDGDSLVADSHEIQFFDTKSTGVEQTGYRLTLSDGRTLACLGDEALTGANAADCRDCDIVMCGAFCRYADRRRFRPYEKHHLTVRDVALTAQEAGIGTLILYHGEDITDDKSVTYAAEAALYYNGRVLVPADGDIINL